jgi:hypothetical protein
MVRLAMVTTALVGVLACGGKGKSEDTGPDDEVVDEGGAAEDDGSGDMIPPEKLEGIQSALDRKRGVASHCLTDAIDAGEVPKNARGKVLVELVVQPNGQARDVAIIKTSLESKTLEACIVDLVSKISFPELPRDQEWSYTFAFEAF